MRMPLCLGKLLVFAFPTCVPTVSQLCPSYCISPLPSPALSQVDAFLVSAVSFQDSLLATPLLAIIPLPSPDFAFGSFSPPRFPLFFPVLQTVLFVMVFWAFRRDFAGAAMAPRRGRKGAGRGGQEPCRGIQESRRKPRQTPRGDQSDRSDRTDLLGISAPQLCPSCALAVP